MKAPIKKSDATDKPKTHPNQTEYNRMFRKRNKSVRITVDFHTANEHEAELYEKLKTYKCTRVVILTALEQFFKNNPWQYIT